MSLFWYPDLNEKYDFEGKPDKGMLLSSYIRYFLARLQSMFKWENLPDSIPQKWLENYLLVNGSCVWVKNGDDLVVTRAGIGGKPDVYFIPTECIVANPYMNETDGNKTYTRDVDCVLMVNDTYAQGVLPLLKKYCSMLVENEITMNIADIMSRATLILSAVDDNTKDSAKLFIKRIIEGNIDVIGESQMLIGNQNNDLTVNQLTAANGTLTNLIEYEQYIKASLYNDLGLQSNYNMKRESINSGESQLNEDMLHPLIDDMLRERQQAAEKVNEMFGTNISVSFNSAWEINEREETAAIEQIEAAAEQTEDVEQVEDGFIEDTSDENVNDVEIEETEENEETPEEQPEEQAEEQPVEQVVELSEETIEEIAEQVVDLIEDKEGEENEKTE